MGVGAGLYMCDVVVKSSRSLSHLLMSSCSHTKSRQYAAFAHILKQLHEIAYFFHVIVVLPVDFTFISCLTDSVALPPAVLPPLKTKGGFLKPS